MIHDFCTRFYFYINQKNPVVCTWRLKFDVNAKSHDQHLSNSLSLFLKSNWNVIFFNRMATKNMKNLDYGWKEYNEIEYVRVWSTLYIFCTCHMQQRAYIKSRAGVCVCVCNFMCESDWNGLWSVTEINLKHQYHKYSIGQKKKNYSIKINGSVNEKCGVSFLLHSKMHRLCEFFAYHVQSWKPECAILPQL